MARAKQICRMHSIPFAKLEDRPEEFLSSGERSLNKYEKGNINDNINIVKYTREIFSSNAPNLFSFSFLLELTSGRLE